MESVRAIKWCTINLGGDVCYLAAPVTWESLYRSRDCARVTGVHDWGLNSEDGVIFASHRNAGTFTGMGR